MNLDFKAWIGRKRHRMRFWLVYFSELIDVRKHIEQLLQTLITEDMWKQRYYFIRAERCVIALGVIALLVFLGLNRFIVVVFIWSIIRLGKTYIRRCNVTNEPMTERFHKIEVLDERYQVVVWKDLWPFPFRRVRKVYTRTFVRCHCHHCKALGSPPTLIRFGRDSVSLFHLWYVRFKWPDQFIPDGELNRNTEAVIKSLLNEKDPPNEFAHREPPPDKLDIAARLVVTTIEAWKSKACMALDQCMTRFAYPI